MMPPILALLICVCFIIWAFSRDMKQRRASSSGVWVAGLWLIVISIRPVSYWLSLAGIDFVATSNLEGSPLDLVVFLGLLITAGIVMSRRRFAWGQFFARNKFLILIYTYLFLSALWASHPVPTLKRAVKDCGSILVALILLTEQNPMLAIRIVFLRVSYLLLPVSLVIIKWFPEIGTIVGRGGDRIFGGVCDHKSSLGNLVFVLGLVILCDLLELYNETNERKNQTAKWIRYGMLFLSLWLLHLCKSTTSLICLVLGVFLMWGTGRLLRLANPAQMIFRCLAFFLAAVIAEITFGVSSNILAALGKNMTLTDRTLIWQMVTEAQSHPFLGFGYYSFWESDVAQQIRDQFLGILNSSHNGYLEMYLDGGFVGLGLLVGLLLIWGRRSIQRLLTGTVFGRMAFMYWVLAILFNNSETSFFRLNPLWFTLILTMIACPEVNRGVFSTPNRRREWVNLKSPS